MACPYARKPSLWARVKKWLYQLIRTLILAAAVLIIIHKVYTVYVSQKTKDKIASKITKTIQ